MLEPEEFDLNLRSANTKMEARRNKVIEAEAIANKPIPPPRYRPLIYQTGS
jgi:hypothetical protein